MIENRHILATVVAAGAEKGLVKRSFREVGGRSLLEIAVNSVLGSKYIDQIVVATDDSETESFCKTRNISVRTDLLYDHPDMMVRTDKCGMKSAQIFSSFDYILILDIGYPLRLASDIDRVLELCHRNSGLPVLTVSDTEIAPQELHYLTGERGMLSVFPKMDESAAISRKLYKTAYSSLVASREYLEQSGTYFGEKSQAYLLPKERAFRVESKADLSIADSLFQKTASGYFPAAVQSQKS